MKSRSVGLAVALMAVLLTATACIDCGHPDVDFALASDVVKQWVGDCLAGHEPGDKWSAATPAEGNANCAFLVRMNGWSSRSVKIISIESRPSVLCAGDIWVFLERGEGTGRSQGQLMVYVTNAKSPGGLLPSKPTAVLASVTYGPFCSMPSAEAPDESVRDVFEDCFWQAAASPSSQ
jgi:hypothetical protein